MNSVFILRRGVRRREVGELRQIIVLDPSHCRAKWRISLVSFVLVLFLTRNTLNQPLVTCAVIRWFLTAFYNERVKKKIAAVVPPRVIYIHNRVLSCVETAGMGSSAGHESSSQCKTIRTEARIKRQSRNGHVILQICSLVCSCLESSKTQCDPKKC